MRVEQKQSVKNSIGRLIFVGLSVLVQIGWFVLLGIRMQRYSTELALVGSILALLIVLRIYGRHINAAFKIPWTILIMGFPALGLSL